jgi:hypothetical protein
MVITHKDELTYITEQKTLVFVFLRRSQLNLLVDSYMIWSFHGDYA